MKTIYLDNAATTPIANEVLVAMQKSLQDNFGNPSSSHHIGRKAKAAIEQARKNIASHFKVSSSEIIFTSSGTEANNLILFNAVKNLGVERIITSKIEHHAVLHPCFELERTNSITLEFVTITKDGSIDLENLEMLLKSSTEKTLVSLMMINNEIGKLLPIDKVATLCKANNALFHSDTVQAVGHYNINLQQLPVDFITASAHKFHGPKGIGFAYFKKGFAIKPMIFGGEQEKGARSSTENVHGIIGLETALTLAYNNLQADAIYISNLKQYFVEQLQKLPYKVRFNADSSHKTQTSYTIVNVQFPVTNSMLLFQLDMAGIAVSAGSACQSGSTKTSHVLQEFLLNDELQNTSIRFSFSKFTTKDDINFTITKLKELLI